MKPAQSAKLRIAFLGDSITVGDGDEEARGWPSRLMELTSPNTGKMHCYNLGVGGDRISDVKARCASELAARLARKEATAVVIMIGINDAVRAAATDGCIPLDKKQLASDFSSILQTAQRYGPVIALEPAPLLASLRREDGGRGTNIMEKLRVVRAIINDACVSHDTPLIPLTDSLHHDRAFSTSLANGDGLHPTSKGYERIAHFANTSSAWSNFLVKI